MALTQRGINIPVTGQITNGDDIVDALIAQGMSVDAAIGGLGAVANLSPEVLAVLEGFDAETDVTDSTVAALVTASSDTRTALDGRYGMRTHVVVGPGGDYASVAAALAAHPSGSVDIEVMAGTYDESIPQLEGVANVTLRGQGRMNTILRFSGDGMVFRDGCDTWHIHDIGFEHTDGANTDDGIDVDYPRRWTIERCWFTGFGNASIHIRGGLQNTIESNIIRARDSTNAGFAGIYVGISLGGNVATTIRTERNYIIGGDQYGIYIFRGNVGCSFVQDIVEYCDVGMRFERCIGGVVEQPYTEQNYVNGIEMADSLMPVIGTLRDEPVYTWDLGTVPASQRRPVRIGRQWINPGEGIVFADSAGVQQDPRTAPSLRWWPGNPNGSLVGVRGAIALRTDGGDNAHVAAVKVSGTGNTGWVPLGVAVGPTGSRPSASSVGAGAQYLDTTLGKPLWSNGTAWIDATGTTV